MARPIRVLLVDDNPEDRGLVERELRNAYPDVQIFEAIDQLQLVDHLSAGDFDLVVTDYHLRWSNGIEVLKAVKRQTPHCPVIMFTATGTEEIAVEAMKHGLDDYIIKNVKHLVRLRGAVQTVLEHAMTKRRADELATRLESVLTQLQVAVFSCSTDGRFLVLNDAMREVLNRNSCPDSLSGLFQNADKGSMFLTNVVNSNEPQETELELLDIHDKSRIFRLNVRLVLGRGRQPRIDGMLEDITRRKESEADAREAAIAATKVAMLSPRESEVFQQVVEGRPNKFIASQLDISIKTVEKHRASLMAKLNTRSIADLVRLAALAERAGG